MRAYITIFIGILLIVVALLGQRRCEGFQAALPSGTQTVTDFVIYSDMNTITQKLPFLHTNFTNIDSVDTTGMTTPLTDLPTTVPKTSFMNMATLVQSDAVVKLYIFKLKNAIIGTIDQAAIDSLNNVSESLFGGAGKIAFRTSGGALYPSIALPAGAAAPAGGAGGSPAAPAAPTTLTLTKQTAAGQTTTGRLWTDLAISDSGSILIGTNYYDVPSISNDGGTTWSLLSNIRFLLKIAISSDAIKIAGIQSTATGSGRQIFTSTDGGITPTVRTSAGQRNWSSIASSTDGTKIAAAVSIGYIYTSTDGGATWTERTSAGSRVWSDILISSDGAKLVANDYEGYIYTSSNGGATWVEQSASATLTNGERRKVVGSADLSKLVAMVTGGKIIISSDGGATWVLSSAPVKTWQGLAISSDGMKIFATADSIYTSIDGGVTWVQQTAADSKSWIAIKCSSDGSKVIASTLSPLTGTPGPDDGYIFTGTFT